MAGGIYAAGFAQWGIVDVTGIETSLRRVEK
jgi:hypothetical protein